MNKKDAEYLEHRFSRLQGDIERIDRRTMFARDISMRDIIYAILKHLNLGLVTELLPFKLVPITKITSSKKGVKAADGE